MDDGKRVEGNVDGVGVNAGKGGMVDVMGPAGFVAAATAADLLLDGGLDYSHCYLCPSPVQRLLAWENGDGEDDDGGGDEYEVRAATSRLQPGHDSSSSEPKEPLR